MPLSRPRGLMLLNGLSDLRRTDLDMFCPLTSGYCISACEVSSLGFGLINIYTMLSLVALDFGYSLPSLFLYLSSLYDACYVAHGSSGAISSIQT
jgi:hypothetical protein